LLFSLTHFVFLRILQQMTFAYKVMVFLIEFWAIT